MSSRPGFTSSLGSTILRYVAANEALGKGFALQRRLLGRVDRFLADRGAPDLTAETFTAWNASIEHLTTNGRRLRLQTVERFCRWRRRLEPHCFVPDASLFPRQRPVARPHIFSEAQIVSLLAHAAAPRRGASALCQGTYRVAIVLLYTAGLRRGELLRLTLGDHEAREGVLRIRETKFHKSRVIPLSRDAVSELETYLALRRRLHLPTGPDARLLLHRRGRVPTPYSADGFGNSMRRLFRAAGIRTASGRTPRIHDLRFTFAMHALTRWYRSSVDVASRMPALATYMGHVSIASTQYYLSCLDAVAHEASERFERHCTNLLDSPTSGGGVR